MCSRSPTRDSRHAATGSYRLRGGGEEPMPAGSTQTVVMFSGGDSSWLAARRRVDTHGPGGMTLLFADTQAEDDDLHRFLDDASANLGLPVTRIADGRDPWQVFHDDR